MRFSLALVFVQRACVLYLRSELALYSAGCPEGFRVRSRLFSLNESKHLKLGIFDGFSKVGLRRCLENDVSKVIIQLGNLCKIDSESEKIFLRSFGAKVVVF